MNIEAIELYSQVKYLQQQLSGCQIQKIFTPTPLSVVLECRGAGCNLHLVADLGGNGPALYLADQVPATPLEPSGFCMLLRKHFEDAYIQQVEQLNFDRIIVLKLNAPVPGDKLVPKELIFELTGRNSNIIFTEQGQIINCLKHITPALSRVRTLLPGVPYQAPIQAGKLHPLAVEAKVLAAVIKNKPEQTLEGKILSTLAGMGRQTALRLAGAENLEEAILRLQQESAAPPDPATNEKIKTKMAQKPLQLDLQKQLLGLVKNTIKHLGKKIALQGKDLEQAENAEEYRYKADTLMAYLYMIKKGQENCSLPSIYNGENLNISLNPALSPNHNAQFYYKKYAKLKRAKIAVAEQIASSREELAYLGEVENSLSLQLTRPEVEEIRQELQEGGYLPKPKNKKASQPQSQPMKIQLADATIYIGKNNRQNDLVTFRLARPNDLWFHTKDIPGSHVILVGEHSPANIDLARKYAAYFSKSRNGSNVPVDMVQKKFVKKPSGSKPGFVIFTNNTTAYVTVDEAEIKFFL